MSKKRTQQLEQAAFDLEMSFNPQEEWSSYELLRDFKLFQAGGRRRITNVLHHKDWTLETEVRIFDYQYTTRTGKTSTTHKQTVFFMQSKKLGLPHFWMQPETAFHKLGEWLGFTKDIDFEEFSSFSDQYRLKGEDEHYIRAVMNDKVLKFFTVQKYWSLEGCNYFLIFYRNHTLLLPDTIHDFYEKGMKLCEMLYESEDRRIGE